MCFDPFGLGTRSVCAFFNQQRASDLKVPTDPTDKTTGVGQL